MALTQELEIYRLSESLILAVYEATDAFPRKAPPRLVESLRQSTPRLHSLILDGCAHRDSGRSAGPWRSALALADTLGHLIDRASDQGLLHPDLTLGLLELQSGVLVRLIILLETVDESRFGKEAPLQPQTSSLPLAA